MSILGAARSLGRSVAFVNKIAADGGGPPLRVDERR